MNSQQINTIATSIIAFFTFLATWGVIVQVFNVKG